MDKERVTLQAVILIVVAEGLRSGVEFGQSVDRSDPGFPLPSPQDRHNGIARQAILLGVLVAKFAGRRIKTEQPSWRGNPNMGAVGIGILRPVHGLVTWLFGVHEIGRELPRVG